jgi:hypothetical protein
MEDRGGVGTRCSIWSSGGGYDITQLVINGPTAGHIARWDPARVLAECEAKRRIVEMHRLGGSYTPGSEDASGFDYCGTCGSGEPYEYPTPWPCPTLRLLALPYVDHPDYRQEWSV